MQTTSITLQQNFSEVLLLLSICLSLFKGVILCDGNFFSLFLEISFGELNEHTTAKFSAYIYTYVEHISKFVLTEIVSHCWTIQQLSHSSLNKVSCDDQDCKRSAYIKQKKSNGILICEIRTSLWTKIFKKCWKLNFRHIIEYFFVNFGVFLRLLQHEKNGSMNQNYSSSACIYMSTEYVIEILKEFVW